MAARQEAVTTGDADRACQQGRRMAYYEVLSLMRDQAVAFDLPLRELIAGSLDPERELL